MTDKNNPVVLPVFSDREFTALFNKQTNELSERLKQTAIAWMKETDDPYGYSVGAAFYAAVWSLSESMTPENKVAMRRACAMTLLSNDKEMQLALAPISSFPN